jgi:hypothetical protein
MGEAGQAARGKRQEARGKRQEARARARGKRQEARGKRQEETMMATFMPVQFGNTPGCYINLDLVKMVTPTTAGCIVHFDKGHTIGITTSAREVATVADTLRREARAVVTAE